MPFAQLRGAGGRNLAKARLAAILYRGLVYDVELTMPIFMLHTASKNAQLVNQAGGDDCRLFPFQSRLRRVLVKEGILRRHRSLAAIKVQEQERSGQKGPEWESA